MIISQSETHIVLAVEIAKATLTGYRRCSSSSSRPPAKGSHRDDGRLAEAGFAPRSGGQRGPPHRPPATERIDGTSGNVPSLPIRRCSAYLRHSRNIEPDTLCEAVTTLLPPSMTPPPNVGRRTPSCSRTVVARTAFL